MSQSMIHLLQVNTLAGTQKSDTYKLHNRELAGALLHRQPRYENCKLINTTLAFEYSSVDAEICSKVDSVLNPTSGVIRAKEIGTLTIEKDRVDPSKTKIICEGK